MAIPNLTSAIVSAFQTGGSYSLPSSSTIDQLTVPAGCTLEGNGALVYVGARDPSKSFLSLGFGARVRNLTIVHPVQNAGEGDAISGTGGGQLIENVQVGSSDIVGGQPSFARGIVLNGPFAQGRNACEARIVDCHVLGCLNASYDVEGLSDGFMTGCVSYNSVPGGQGIGMRFGVGSAGWQVIANHVYGTTKWGAYYAGSALVSRSNRIETGSVALACVCGEGVTMKDDVLWAVPGYANDAYAAIQLGDKPADLWAQYCVVDVFAGEFKPSPSMPKTPILREAEGAQGDYTFKTAGAFPIVNPGGSLHAGSVLTVKQIGKLAIVVNS